MRLIALVGLLVTQLASAAPVAPPVADVRPREVSSANGKRIDPYFWLRDDTRSDPQVLAYLRAENAYKDAMLSHTKTLQEKLYGEIVARIKQDDSTAPYLRGGYWYYRRYQPGGEHPIYARKRTPEGAEEILVDGNERSRGHGYYDLGAVEISPDSRYVAFAEDTVGRYQYAIRVRDMRTGKLLPDVLENVETDIAWTNDNRTFLYVAKHPVTLLGLYVKRHALGSSADADRLVFEQTDTAFYTRVARSKSGRFVFVFMESTLSSEWRYAAADDRELVFRTVLPRQADHEYQVADLNDRFVIRTNWKAPNFRVVEVPIAHAHDQSRWRDTVAHRDDAFVGRFDVSNAYLAIEERSGGLSKLRVRTWQHGKDRLIAADERAYTMQLGDNVEIGSAVVRYVYTSLTTPRTVIDYDVRTGRRTTIKEDPVLGGYDKNRYATELLRIKARDGSEVPVSIVYRKDVKRDGRAPLWQYAYGSYGSSQNPAFGVHRASLLDRGIVYALAHVRGGQELGRTWYDQGRTLNKKNTFTDFIDVTSGLVHLGYAAPDKVVAMGGSAGGLLMGAVANMAPEKYRAIIAEVPFVDVVTTMLDDTIPLTSNEYDEWGNPDDRNAYEYMLSYSPYDQVARQAYPAMLVTTGLWDSQVQYFEPAKWVAKLRAMKTDAHPLLLHTNMEAGHAGHTGRFQQYRELALEYAFALDQLGIRE